MTLSKTKAILQNCNFTKKAGKEKDLSNIFYEMLEQSVNIKTNRQKWNSANDINLESVLAPCWGSDWLRRFKFKNDMHFL